MDFLDEQRMSHLYEKFILEYYKKHFPELHASASAIEWQLDDGNKYLLPAMQSDIVLEKDKKMLIIDAKFYSHNTQVQFNKHSIHSANLYQIFTYVKNKDIELKKKDYEVSGMLLYAKTNDEIDKVILIGNRAEVKDSCCVVWSKVVDNGNYDYTQQWMYQPFYANQWHNGLALNHLSVTPYNDGILMIGGKGLGTCKASAFSTMYFSRDDGQNWWKDSRFFLPPGFDSDLESFAMVTDADDYIWILCGNTGQVWRGHLSQLTWK